MKRILLFVVYSVVMALISIFVDSLTGYKSEGTSLAFLVHQVIAMLSGAGGLLVFTLK